MKLTKTCAKFLRKHGGTILAVAASVGVVATAIETGRATTKAQHILEVDKELTKFNENEFGVTEEPPTKKQIVLMCWKAYVPAAILGGGTIACILGSNALNKKQIAGLTAAYMALGKTYQTYRQKVIENIGLEKEAEIQEQISEEKLPEVRDKMAEEKLLCYEPISKRYFHATKAELLGAFYDANRDFSENGYIALNDFFGYLGLDFVPELDNKGWSVDYLGAMWENYWIDFNYSEQKTDDGLEVYYVDSFQPPVENYIDYDPYADYCEKKGE